MPTCFFLILFLSFFFLFSHSSNSKSDHCYVCVLYNSSMLMSHCHYNVVQERQFVNLIITHSNFIATLMVLACKFHFFCFREPLTPYCFLFPNFILRPLLSCKCLIIYLLLFLSDNFYLIRGLVPLRKFNNISLLDVYELFSITPLPKLRIAMLNA